MTAVTTTYFPAGLSRSRSRIDNFTFALVWPYASNSSLRIPAADGNFANRDGNRCLGNHNIAGHGTAWPGRLRTCRRILSCRGYAIRRFRHILSHWLHSPVDQIFSLSGILIV